MGVAGEVDIEVLQLVTRNLAASLASIRFDQWSSSTPCTGWDLTALVDHVTGGNWFTAEISTGARAEDAMTTTMERFGGTSATSDVAIESFEEQLAAFSRPQILDRHWNHVAGDLTGHQVLRLRLHDLIVHSWDIAEALQAGAHLPDELLLWGLEELGRRDSLAAQHFALGNPTVCRSVDGGPATYLRMFGR